MNRMKELRQERGITMKDAAQQLNLPYTTYVNYEKGTREPNSETLIQIANFFNTSIDYLLGKSNTRIDDRVLDVVNELDLDTLAQAGNIRDALKTQQTNNASASPIPPGFEPLPEMESVPLVGRIACGQPITAEENVEGHVSIPAAWHATFTLQCRGDSMEPTIHDGDLVAIRKDVQVENGQIAAVRIGDEATLKHLYLHDDYIELRPENPTYASIIRHKEEMNDVTIEGRAVGLCRGL